MSLIETIKAKNIEARKARSAATATLLTTVIGEDEVIGKNAGNRAPTDEEVQKVLAKFIKNNNETIAALGHASPRAEILMAENVILEAFLPTQMSLEQLTATVRAIVIGLKMAEAKIDMGTVMKILKDRFAGQYDGKMASTVIKAELAQ